MKKQNKRRNISKNKKFKQNKMQKFSKISINKYLYCNNN